jgi:hypothetical protein
MSDNVAVLAGDMIKVCTELAMRQPHSQPADSLHALRSLYQMPKINDLLRRVVQCIPTSPLHNLSVIPVAHCREFL